MYEGLNILKELHSYYPSWLLEFNEMKAIVFAASKMLEGAKTAILKLLQNQFVEQADEGALRELERFLAIQYTLERGDRERRDFVSSQFVGNGSFGVNTIKEIVNVFTENPCNVRYSPEDAIDVEITRDANDSFVLDDCIEMLNKRKPAHLKINVMVSTPFYVDAYLGFLVSEFRREVIDSI